MLDNLNERNPIRSFGAISQLLREKHSVPHTKIMRVLKLDESDFKKFEEGHLAKKWHPHVTERLSHLAIFYNHDDIRDMANEGIGVAVKKMRGIKGMRAEFLAKAITDSFSPPLEKHVSENDLLEFEQTGKGLKPEHIKAIARLSRYSSIGELLHDALDKRHKIVEQITYTVNERGFAIPMLLPPRVQTKAASIVSNGGHYTQAKTYIKDTEHTKEEQDKAIEFLDAFFTTHFSKRNPLLWGEEIGIANKCALDSEDAIEQVAYGLYADSLEHVKESQVHKKRKR